MQRDFSHIYEASAWDGTVRSGPGSDPTLNRKYISLVQRFIRERDIRTVVDLGCGDWSFSRLIDWAGADYVGIDVVPTLIETLNRTYGRRGVRFVQGDLLTCDLPPADLAVSKDVLQHWPNEAILRFFERLRGFRYAILVNDSKVICRRWQRLWLGQEIFTPNADIQAGDYRPVRLREPPFNLDAQRVGVIKMYVAKFLDPQRRPEVEHKEVLLWTNPAWSRSELEVEKR